MKIVYAFMFDGPKRAGTGIESDAIPWSFKDWGQQARSLVPCISQILTTFNLYFDRTRMGL